MKLSGTQKTQWQKLKAEIVKRPLLAFIAGLSKEEVNTYLNDGEPTATRLEEINNALLQDRIKKTERVREALATKVGHRGAVRFANKIGVSDGTIRNIIDRKYKVPPSYDLLGRIEIYLYYSSDFSLSPEQIHVQKSFVQSRVHSLAAQTRSVSQRLVWAADEFGRVIAHDKKIKRYVGGPQPGKFDKFPLDEAQDSITQAIETLNHIKAEIGVLIEDFCSFQ